MKKSILLLIAISITECFTQETNAQNFLGKNFKLYKGAYLKLNDNSNSGFSNSFFSDIKNAQNEYNGIVVYPEIKRKYITVKDSLINRVFLVEGFVDKNGKEFASADPFEKPFFVLKDTLNNQKIFFKYSKDIEEDFPFNTSSIVLPESIICSAMERRVDDFTGEITINSPSRTFNNINSLILYKYIKKQKSLYYLSLSTTGATAVVDGKGVDILFTDGTKWTRLSEVDVNVETGGYRYSAFITLTPADLITFSTKTIKKFRLYVFDADLNQNYSEKFKTFVKCLKEAK